MKLSLSIALKAALLLMVTLLAACASLPSDYAKEPSTALRETSHTQLAQKVQPLLAAYPGESGFYPLHDGVDALAARLRLIDRAEVGIDLQYFLFHPDLVGDLMLKHLFDAAGRGVRVRLLLDDISTEGYEQAFAVFEAQPNFEIRLTNPFADRDSKAANVVDIKRVNHRMHNKSITFDNQVTIVGGRNIADEYFGTSSQFNFYDFDVLAIGPVVDQVSSEFDAYWNAGESYPVSAFVDPDPSPEATDALKAKFDKTMTKVVTSDYRDTVDSEIVNFILGSDTSPLIWAPARVVADLPYGEVSEEGVPGPAVLGRILIDAMHEAQEEFLLVSPYFVPTEKGVESFRLLRDRGARCAVLTNSLASTDVVAVYGGYKDYQKALLEMGVELWELKPYADYSMEQRGAPTERRALHAKIFAVDRELLFVGSFNWDPRSLKINTEMGMLIESPELTDRVAETLSAGLPGVAWKLRLNKEGEVEWLNLAEGKEVVFDKEPGTDSWRRMQSRMSSIDGLEDQL